MDEDVREERRWEDTVRRGASARAKRGLDNRQQVVGGGDAGWDGWEVGEGVGWGKAWRLQKEGR